MMQIQVSLAPSAIFLAVYIETKLTKVVYYLALNNLMKRDILRLFIGVFLVESCGVSEGNHLTYIITKSPDSPLLLECSTQGAVF